MSPYLTALAPCARISLGVWLFHLPAVTEDLGHLAESGVRGREGCLCVCVCVCVRMLVYIRMAEQVFHYIII